MSTLACEPIWLPFKQHARPIWAKAFSIWAVIYVDVQKSVKMRSDHGYEYGRLGESFCGI